MSRLSIAGRPWVAFEPENRQHRKWYFEFAKSRTWGRCPVRFIVPEDHGNLVMMIEQQLTKYYIDREFGKIDS